MISNHPQLEGCWELEGPPERRSRSGRRSSMLPGFERRALQPPSSTFILDSGIWDASDIMVVATVVVAAPTRPDMGRLGCLKSIELHPTST
jgi:hypothetical protein